MPILQSCNDNLFAHHNQQRTAWDTHNYFEYSFVSKDLQYYIHAELRQL